MGVNTNRVIAADVPRSAASWPAPRRCCTCCKFGVTRCNAGFLLGIKAFTAAVLGGIGNVRGALLGGLRARPGRELRLGPHRHAVEGRRRLRAAGRHPAVPADRPARRVPRGGRAHEHRIAGARRRAGAVADDDWGARASAGRVAVRPLRGRAARGRAARVLALFVYALPLLNIADHHARPTRTSVRVLFTVAIYVLSRSGSTSSSATRACSTWATSASTRSARTPWRSSARCTASAVLAACSSRSPWSSRSCRGVTAGCADAAGAR